MEEKKKETAKRIRDLAAALVFLADELEGKKQDKEVPVDLGLQPIVKAIFELNQRIDDLEARMDRRTLLAPRLEKEWQGEVLYGPDKPTEAEEETPEESLSAKEQEARLIRKALEKHGGNRKLAAEELGMSERTLYRKLPPEYRKPWKRSKEE